ncbi:MAG: hypothetical protein QOG43_1732 [Actinomycetota bacterium]|nr:hypothetical protein [Actinomycetota bacterium]
MAATTVTHAPAEPAPGEAPPAESIPVDPTRSMRNAFRGIGSVVAPTSAVTALLYYFGWTRTTIEAHLLGLDDSLLGYSTQDYLLRSMSSMFGPLVVGLLAALAALGLHAAVVAWVRDAGGPDDPRLRRLLGRLVLALGAVAGVTLAVGIAGARVRRPSDVVYVASPMCVTVSIVVGCYAANIHRRFLARRRRDAVAGELKTLRGVSATLVVLLLVLSLFWNVSHYAAVRGRSLASTVEALLPSQPTVVVYSAKRLYLQAPVVETRLDQGGADAEASQYQYAYTGLKLLFRSDHHYFLRPAAPGSRANIVVPDDLDIRLEFYSGG